MDRASSGRTDDDQWWSAAGDAVDGLVGQGVGDRVLGPRHVCSAPPLEAGEDLSTGGPQRDQLGVLDAPSTGELLDDQLRIEEQMDLVIYCKDLDKLAALAELIIRRKNNINFYEIVI